mgnify:CR=1 FL=1
MPLPGKLGHMEIQHGFVAMRGQDRYAVIVICNSDRPGDPERTFFVYAPLALHGPFADTLAQLRKDLIVTVCEQGKGMIEIFFHRPPVAS